MAEISYVGSAALISRLMTQVIPAVQQSAEDLVSQAQDMTPVDTGTLKGSIQVSEDAAVSGSAITAKVQTGGESSEYAFYVHEGHYAVHGAGPGGYGPRNATYVAPVRYLTIPLLANANVYKAAIEAAARGAF